MTVTVTVLTASPKAGQPVDFKIVVDQPDAPIYKNCVARSFGDVPEIPCNGMAQMCPDSPQATGTWPPPEKKPDRYETTITHTYSSAGTYTATFASWTAAPSCNSPDNKDPYRNKRTATVTITVKP